MAATLLRALLAFTIILGAAPARSQPILSDWSGLYTGWGETGWGINLAMHGDAYFISWLTYDTDGSQMWLVVPRAAREGLSYRYYSGPMYRTTGPAFSQMPWNPSAVGVTQVGTGTLSFEGPVADEYFRFTYVLNGVTGHKDLMWQVFGAFPFCPGGGGTKPVYQDLWWGGAAESGWGLHVNHQGDVVFAIWLTYDAAGRGTWVVMPRGERIGASESFSGALYRTTGPAFNSQAWDSSRVIVTEVGRATLDFADIGSGTFTYTMQGVTQSKAISRQGVSYAYGNCRTH